MNDLRLMLIMVELFRRQMIYDLSELHSALC